VLLAEKAEQDVLGPDEVVAQRACLVLREHDHLARLVCESLIHHFGAGAPTARSRIQMILPIRTRRVELKTTSRCWLGRRAALVRIRGCSQANLAAPRRSGPLANRVNWTLRRS
jgi:hypothetical protein